MSDVNNYPRIKTDLIAGLDEGRAAARAFVETLSPRLGVHESSDWTVRDLVIHLASLEADMIRAMQNAIDGLPFTVDLRGQSTPSDLYELRRGDRASHSWQEVLEEWRRIRRQLRGMVLAFPLDKMETPFSTPFFVDYNLAGAVQVCGAHEREHLAEMRAAAEREG